MRFLKIVILRSISVDVSEITEVHPNKKQKKVVFEITVTSTAFDSINHKILIGKLEKYGIRGVPLQLLSSFLFDRQQRTKI